MSNFEELKATFQPVINNHLELFPNSKAGLRGTTITPNTIDVITAIFNAELHGCTIHNDPFHTSLSIEKISEDQYELTAPYGIGLHISPRPNEPHLAFSIVKLAFRKTKGDAKKIIAKIKDLQQKQLALVKEYRSEINNFDISNLKDI